jgi:hypothetical protein
MTRITTYYPEGNLTSAEVTESTITEVEVDQLKEISKSYPNRRIYTNKNGNLCIVYGRYINEIII